MAAVVHELRRPPSHRSVRRPAVLRWLPTAVAALIFLSVWLRIRQWWFIPGRWGFGYTEWVARTTIEGTAIAPNQYRPLAPWMAQLLAESMAAPLPTALVLLDLTMLVVLVAVLHVLGARIGCPEVAVVAALAWAWWSTKLDHWHPETVLLAVLASLALLALLAQRPRPWLLLVVASVMLGVRTDYAATFGLTVLAVGIVRKCWRTGSTGLLVVAVAAAATQWLAEVAYPQASYIVDVVQLPFNLTAGSLAMAATFYGSMLLVIALAAVRTQRPPPCWPAAVWFVLELGSVFVVGRVEETRIFMPLAPVIGAAALMAYLELRRVSPEDRRPSDWPLEQQSGASRIDDRSAATRPRRVAQPGGGPDPG